MMNTISLNIIFLLTLMFSNIEGQHLPLPKLDYNYDELEPILSEKAMLVHHLKHHKSYTDKLNTVLEEMRYFDDSESNKLAKLGIDKLLEKLNEIPEKFREKIRNNGGGYVNHDLYFKLLKPLDIKDGQEVDFDKRNPSQPRGPLYEALITKFKSFSYFREVFEETAMNVFGSGWVWLYYSNESNDLEIMATSNQDSPFMEKGRIPIICLDIWEHAYYLNYMSDRKSFIKKWWYIINWDYAEELFYKAKITSKEDL